MLTPDEFRALALKVPGAVESAHGGHPDFRLGGKVFASLGAPDEQSAMIKLPLDQQRELVTQMPTILRPCRGFWGTRGYTNVRLAAADVARIRSALAAAAKAMRATGKRAGH
jgi:hypothetical protein